MLFTRPAFAEDKKDIMEIEETDIPKLTIDETREVPEYKLLPPPAPTPEEKKEVPQDKRSWIKSPYSKEISVTAKKYKLDPQVIYATIMTESEGDPNAFRYEPGLKDASLCLGQILVSTAKSLGFAGKTKDMYKTDVCIDLIGKYHRKMLDTYGDLTPTQLAIAYNAGSPWKRPVRGHLTRFKKWFDEEAG